MEYNTNQNMGEEIRFDEELTADIAEEFEPLPEGIYNFTAVYKNQARHDGTKPGSKIGSCAVINVDIMVEGVAIPHRLYMNTKAARWPYGLYAFFVSLGLAEKGGRFRPDWNAIAGRTGRCEVGIRTWTGSRDGKEHKSNEIKSFLEPDPNAAPAQSTYQAPAQPQWNRPQQMAPGQQTTMSGYPTGNPGHWQAGKF